MNEQDSCQRPRNLILGSFVDFLGPPNLSIFLLYEPLTTVGAKYQKKLMKIFCKTPLLVQVSQQSYEYVTKTKQKQKGTKICLTTAN